MGKLRIEERISEARGLKEHPPPRNTLSTSLSKEQDSSGPRTIRLPSRRHSSLPRVVVVLTALSALALLRFVCLYSHKRKQLSGINERRLATGEDEDASNGSSGSWDADVCADFPDIRTVADESPRAISSSSIQLPLFGFRGKRKGGQDAEEARDDRGVKRPRFAEPASNADLSDTDFLVGMSALEDEGAIALSWLVDDDQNDFPESSVSEALSPSYKGASEVTRGRFKNSEAAPLSPLSTPLRSPLSFAPQTPGSGASFSPLSQADLLLEDADDTSSEGSHHNSHSATFVVEQGSSSGELHSAKSPTMSAESPGLSTPLGSPLSPSPRTPGSGTSSPSLSPWTLFEFGLLDSDESASGSSENESDSETEAAGQASSSVGSYGRGSPLLSAEFPASSTPLGSPLSPSPCTPGNGTPSSSPSSWTLFELDPLGSDDSASEGSHHSSQSTLVVEQDTSSGGSQEVDSPFISAEGSRSTTPLRPPLSPSPLTTGTGTPSSSRSRWTLSEFGSLNSDDTASEGSYHSSHSGPLVVEQGSSSGGSHEGEPTFISAGSRSFNTPPGSPLWSIPKTPGSGTAGTSPATLSPWTMFQFDLLDTEDTASEGSHPSSRSGSRVVGQKSSVGSPFEGSPFSSAGSSAFSTSLGSPLSSAANTSSSGMSSASLSPLKQLELDLPDSDDPASEGSHRSSHSGTPVVEQGSSGRGAKLTLPGGSSAFSTPLRSPLSSTPHTPSVGMPSASLSPLKQLRLDLSDSDDTTPERSRRSSHSGALVVEQSSSSGGSHEGEPTFISAGSRSFNTPPGSPLWSIPKTPGSGTAGTSPATLSPWTMFQFDLLDTEDTASEGSHPSSRSGSRVVGQNSSVGSPFEGSPFSSAGSSAFSTSLGSPLSSAANTSSSGMSSASLSPLKQLELDLPHSDDPASEGSHRSSHSGTPVVEQGSSGRGAKLTLPGGSSAFSTPLRSPLSSTPHTPSVGMPSASLSPLKQLRLDLSDSDDTTPERSRRSSHSGALVVEQSSSSGGSHEGEPTFISAGSRSFNTPPGSPLWSIPKTPGSGTPGTSPATLSPWTMFQFDLLDTEDTASEGSHPGSRSGSRVVGQDSSVGSPFEGSPFSSGGSSAFSTPLGSPLSSTPHTPSIGMPSASLSPLKQLRLDLADSDDTTSEGTRRSSHSGELVVEQGSSSGGSHEGEPTFISAGSRSLKTPPGSPLWSTPKTPGSGRSSATLSPWTMFQFDLLDTEDTTSEGSHHSSRSGSRVVGHGSSVGSPPEGSPFSSAGSSAFSSPLGPSLSSAPHTSSSGMSSGSLAPSTQPALRLSDCDDTSSEGSHHSSHSGELVVEQGSSGRGSHGEGSPSLSAQSAPSSTPLDSPQSSAPHARGSATSTASLAPSTHPASPLFNSDDPASEGSYRSSHAGTPVAEQGSTSRESPGEGSPSSSGKAPESSTP